MSSTKYCEDCRHHELRKGYHRCSRKQYTDAPVSREIVYTPSCYNERRGLGIFTCGIWARHFEPKNRG
jgi:hypothetical protein